jgi:hypothetical protein
MQLRSKAWKLGRALAVSTVVPLPALACPNCYAASGPRVLLMYYLSAIGLSLMPFAIIGAIVGLTVFLKRQLQQDAEEPLPAELNP